MDAMKVGILGSGQVAKVLAAGFLKHGHAVMIGTRDQGKLRDWKAKTQGVQTGTFEEAAAFGEVIILAVKGTAAEALVKKVENVIQGKVIIDTTNPIADAPPVNGVLQFFTTLNDSLMERLQQLAPAAKFVKAFNSVGNSLMVNPVMPDGKPNMFICGNDDGAKRVVKALLNQFGWETNDFGKVESARAIEPLCMLWCIPGFLYNEWTHAFKLVKQQ